MSVVETGILVNAVVRSEGEGPTEGVVSTVCWLASSECSFTTGTVFEVGGGTPSLYLSPGGGEIVGDAPAG